MNTRVAAFLVAGAARCAPAGLSQRLAEEWGAHLAQLPEGAGRFRFGLDCWRAVVSLVLQAPQSAAAVASVRPIATAVAGTVAAAAQATAPSRLSGSGANRRFGPKGAPGGTPICEMNITPLIDVMLVLVVTLVLSLPVMTHSVKMALPLDQPRTDNPVLPIRLAIDFDDSVSWNGGAVTTAAELDRRFAAEARRQPQAAILLWPDRRASYDAVARVLAAAQRNGMTRLSFANTGDFGSLH